MATTIRVVTNGPLQVSGDVQLVDHQGTAIPTKEKFSLCRCGASTTKPFCDGTHTRIGFDAAARAVREDATA